MLVLRLRLPEPLAPLFEAEPLPEPATLALRLPACALAEPLPEPLAEELEALSAVERALLPAACALSLAVERAVCAVLEMRLVACEATPEVSGRLAAPVRLPEPEPEPLAFEPVRSPDALPEPVAAALPLAWPAVERAESARLLAFERALLTAPPTAEVPEFCAVEVPVLVVFFALPDAREVVLAALRETLLWVAPSKVPSIELPTPPIEPPSDPPRPPPSDPPRPPPPSSWALAVPGMATSARVASAVVMVSLFMGLLLP